MRKSLDTLYWWGMAGEKFNRLTESCTTVAHYDAAVRYFQRVPQVTQNEVLTRAARKHLAACLRRRKRATDGLEAV